jgi:pheromone a factor receptor
MHNFGRVPYDHFKSHIESRSPFTASLFIRRIAISLIMTGSLCLVCVFSVLSISTFESWTSWSAVHADFSVINVVTSPDDVGSIRLTWWSIPTVSIIYIILSFVIGEEVRDASKWIRKMVSRVDKPRSVFPMLLPTQ